MDLNILIPIGISLVLGLVGYYERERRIKNDKEIVDLKLELKEVNNEIESIKKDREKRNEKVNDSLRDILVALARITK